MIAWLDGRHRRILIRSYLFLAGGLIVVAIVLDLGFSALQERHARAEDPWLQSTFRLIESAIAVSPPADRALVADQLSRQLGIEVRILDDSDIIAAPRAADATQVLVDDSGNSYYLQQSSALHTTIRIGPLAASGDGLSFRLLPAMFYLSILVIVALWLRPLLKDLRLLTDASQRFAADYREPLMTASRTTQLTNLATNLDMMSRQLSYLIQNQKELTAALSHEMRTPLARIRFALAVIANQTDTSVQSRLQGMNADVQQIDDLIAKMLDYARLDHPDLRMEWQHTPLDEWLRHAIGSCGSSERLIEVIRHDGVTSAWMEPRLMELALSNLVVNACRHARQHVAVTISVAAGCNRVAVEDDGEGIPEADRDAIFKAFARLDTSRNRDTGGYGLGLAIVARVAALHRGSVSVATSEKLGGAKFTLEWPLAEHGVTCSISPS
ncbi:MAG: ATP-binding protein, partial [Burkholderiales bacterium]